MWKYVKVIYVYNHKHVLSEHLKIWLHYLLIIYLLNWSDIFITSLNKLNYDLISTIFMDWINNDYLWYIIISVSLSLLRSHSLLSPVLSLIHAVVILFLPLVPPTYIPLLIYKPLMSNSLIILKCSWKAEFPLRNWRADSKKVRPKRTKEHCRVNWCAGPKCYRSCSAKFHKTYFAICCDVFYI